MFDPEDRKFMSDSVNEVISSFNQVMHVTRPQELNQPSFSGRKKAPLTVVGTYAIDMDLLNPGSLVEKGADLAIQCGGQTDIRENDRVDVDGAHFIVSHVKPQNLGGVITHLEIDLEKDASYGS